MKTFAVKGGIGDFLQCLPFMKKNPQHQYLVASHYNRAVEFFSALDIKVLELPFGRMIDVELCPRELFFEDVLFGEGPLHFLNGCPVIGVHLGGSDYSISVEKRFGFPPKALPLAVLKSLVVNQRYNFAVFSSPLELHNLIPNWQKFIKENLKFIAHEDVTSSLSYVAGCSALIGSDSAFKTMSSMLKIPTMVWIGNYRDDYRDKTFIDPYIRAGVMTTFRYSDLGEWKEVNSGIELSLKWLDSLSLNSAELAW